MHASVDLDAEREHLRVGTYTYWATARGAQVARLLIRLVHDDPTDRDEAVRLRLVNVTSGRLEAAFSLKGNQDAYVIDSRFALSPDGISQCFGAAWAYQGVFCVSPFESALLWQRKDVKHAQELILHPDGTRLVAVLEDRASVVLSAEDGTTQAVLDGADNGACSRDGSVWYFQRHNQRTCVIRDGEFRKLGSFPLTRKHVSLQPLVLDDGVFVPTMGEEVTCYELDGSVRWRCERAKHSIVLFLCRERELICAGPVGILDRKEGTRDGPLEYLFLDQRTGEIVDRFFYPGPSALVPLLDGRLAFDTFRSVIFDVISRRSWSLYDGVPADLPGVPR